MIGCGERDAIGVEPVAADPERRSTHVDDSVHGPGSPSAFSTMRVAADYPST